MLGVTAIVVLGLAFINVNGRWIANSALDNSWSSFQRLYEKAYGSVEEETHRRQIWEENLSMIHQHNLEADMNVHSYRLAMNPFGDMTNDEFRRQMNGFRMINATERNPKGRHTFRQALNVHLPDAVDWRTKGYVTGVKDQGQCGSCWAFSATGSLEGQHFAKTSQLISLSEQNLVDCSHKDGNFGCNGGFMELAFLYIKSNGGIDTEATYPYEARNGKCRFDPKNIGATDRGFVLLKPGSEADLQAAIATVGPISVAIDAGCSSFQFYSSGIYNEPYCSAVKLDHGVLVVGYGSQDSQEYYIVKNSWGVHWGNGGYIWMSRNKKNQCGIATLPSYPLV